MDGDGLLAALNEADDAIKIDGEAVVIGGERSLSKTLPQIFGSRH